MFGLVGYLSSVLLKDGLSILFGVCFFFSKTWQELCLSIKEGKKLYVHESLEVRLAPPGTHRKIGNTQLLPPWGVTQWRLSRVVKHPKACPPWLSRPLVEHPWPRLGKSFCFFPSKCSTSCISPPHWSVAVAALGLWLPLVPTMFLFLLVGSEAGLG